MTQLPASLFQEVEEVLKNARNKRTGDPLGDNTKTGYRQVFREFYATTAARAPGRTLARLADFSAEDIEEYNRVLEGDPGQLKPNSIIGRIMAVNGVFKAAFAQKIIPTKINHKVYWPKGEEQYRRLHQDELEKLFFLDEKRLEKMNLKDRFVCLRNKTMAVIQKDVALRISEPCHLGFDNILWNQRSRGGIVPLEIWEGKWRPRGTKEIVYLTPWGVAWLKRYLEIRKEYLAATGLRPGQALSPKSRRPMGEALFISEKTVAPIKEHGYTKIFRALADEARLSKECTSHWLRHTRITEWVESGLDPKRVQKLARHESLEMTLKYYHFNEKELLLDLDKRFGSVPATAPVKMLLLPEKSVCIKILRHALQNAGQESDDAAMEAMYARLAENLKPGSSQDLYYAVHETCERLRIGRTQLYKGWIAGGWLHPLKIGKTTAFLKTEVDALASYRTSAEASKALGYKEKTPVTVAKLAEEGIIPAKKIGRGWAFKDKDLIDFAIDKRSGRLRLKKRLAVKGLGIGAGAFLRPRPWTPPAAPQALQ